ncbi:MAG: L-seryl-tRNA(Sec) selenium transferase, partial [Chloroflexi bacterium]
MGGDSAEPLFRSLPSVDRVLRTDPIAGLTNGQSPAAVARVVRRVLEESRVCIRQGKEAPTLERIVAAVAERVAGWEPHPRRVINATGVILHTNLGRAPLSSDALQAIVGASAYSDLEYDLEDGRRGSRQQHVRLLLQALLDAEASHVTVNSASAVLLMLTALVKGREVIVSRGQAVEIGGGFRIPEILRQSGALLVEVGTTNRTRLADYVEAVSDRTGAILHVHPSNFHVVGFTEEASLAELASLAGDRNVLLLSDNGSGALYDTVRF